MCEYDFFKQENKDTSHIESLDWFVSPDWLRPSYRRSSAYSARTETIYNTLNKKKQKYRKKNNNSKMSREEGKLCLKNDRTREFSAPNKEIDWTTRNHTMKSHVH